MTQAVSHSPEEPTLRAVMTVLETLVAQVGVQGTRFDNLESRFDSLESRFDNLESRFDSLESRFDSLEEQVAGNTERITLLFELVEANTQELRIVGNRLTRVELRLDGVEDELRNVNRAIEHDSRRLIEHDKRILALERSSQ